MTGDAVNVAARLEQVAPPGKVLFGAGTVQLVQGTVDVSPVGSLELKGKAEPAPAWELLRCVARRRKSISDADDRAQGRTGAAAGRPRPSAT